MDWQRAAPFLGQKGGFSCRNTHAFNRVASSQMSVCLKANQFPLEAFGFPERVSPALPSFPWPPFPVLLAFIEGI
jgi:hypothetical protein